MATMPCPLCGTRMSIPPDAVVDQRITCPACENKFVPPHLKAENRPDAKKRPPPPPVLSSDSGTFAMQEPDAPKKPKTREDEEFEERRPSRRTRRSHNYYQSNTERTESAEDEEGKITKLFYVVGLALVLLLGLLAILRG